MLEFLDRASGFLGGQRFESGLFRLEQFTGLPPGAAVDPHVGHRVQPLAGGGQLTVVMIVLDLAVQFIVDHVGSFIRRKISPRLWDCPS